MQGIIFLEVIKLTVNRKELGVVVVLVVFEMTRLSVSFAHIAT
jgi:hypothetical protein